MPSLIRMNFQSDRSIAPIIQDNKSLLEEHITWKVAHVRRGANLVAHNLAKWAVTENLDGNIPICCIPLDILNSDNPLCGMNLCLEKNKKKSPFSIPPLQDLKKRSAELG